LLKQKIKNESGEIPERTGHCKWRANSYDATGYYYREG